MLLPANQVGQHRSGLFDHLAESGGFKPAHQIHRRGRWIEPPADRVLSLAEKLLHLRDDGVGIRIRERGHPNHIAHQMGNIRRGMRPKAREDRDVPLPGQFRKLEKAVLERIKNQCLARGHGGLAAGAWGFSFPRCR